MPLAGGGGDDRSGYAGRDVKPQQGGRYYDDRERRPDPQYHGGGGGGYRAYGGAGISVNDLAARRAQRDASTVSVWPKSPERSYEDLLARDTGKDRKRDRKHKHRRDKKSSSSKKHRKRRDTSSEEESSGSETDDSRERRRRKRKRDEKRHRSPSPDRRRATTPPKISDDLDDISAWVVKGESAPVVQGMSILGSAATPTTEPVSSHGVALAGALARVDGDDEEDEEVGPQLPIDSNAGGSTTVKYDSKA
jgi:hypothetical protein